MKIWLLIAGLTVATAAIKAFGPIALGGRELSERFTRVIALMAPPLLAALVVTSTLADEDRLAVGADTVGVAVALLALWRGVNIVVGVAIAVAVTAGLRAL